MSQGVIAYEGKQREEEPLYLSVHGRILEQLGIQMYQTPVNALAEFVANAWDAEASEVHIRLPDQIAEDAEVAIADDGMGMTREDCRKRFLYVGYNRRGANPDERTPNLNRAVLGRKGIGKFAGFGIAQVIRVDTVSGRTGQRTVFELDLADLLGDEYIGAGGRRVRELRDEPASPDRFSTQGTVITLRQLTLKQNIRTDFAERMARRFLLLEQQAGFRVKVNGEDLPQSIDLADIQYSFPRDYEAEEMPDGIRDVDGDTGWGTEILPDGEVIRWRFLFHTDTIDDEELRGVTIFAKNKLIQSPFLFQLTGGLGGQHGVEYLTGQVEASYLDVLPEDVTATERQRVNWSHPKAQVLLHWGQERVKALLALWRDRRGRRRQEALELKIGRFGARLTKLPSTEAETVRRALRRIATIETLNDQQFEELATSVVTAWEQGRLRVLIEKLSSVDELSHVRLVDILTEEDVLSALHIAEAVKTKLLTIGELQRRIEQQELETEVRDHIAENPWLISPDLQSYAVERGVGPLIRQLAGVHDLPAELAAKRVDLVLSQGRQLVLLEFMRPGISLDLDHLNRFEDYFRAIRVGLRSTTGGRFDAIRGFVVADDLAKDPVLADKIIALEHEGMLAMNWQTLLDQALSKWREFLSALASRHPHDPRLAALLTNEPM